jgi:hypothetical protein
MVRPIDLQDNLSKTQAAERMNQIQKAHGEMGQRQVADALKEKVLEDLSKTKASQKGDMVTIRDEQKRKQDDREKEQNEDREKKDSDQHEDEDSSPRLDLKG